MANFLKKIERPFFTDAEVKMLLPNASQDSRYGKIKRLLAKGDILHVKRGLFLLNDKARLKPHPFELAQHIYGPSFISLESALSFHQLIPEAVHTVTSVTGKRSKEFTTPLGIFSYIHLPMENLYMGVEVVKINNANFFIAKPWRAICDYVYCHKKNWHNLEPLHRSLRIELENLPPITYEEIASFNDYYQQHRMARFLKGVQEKL